MNRRVWWVTGLQFTGLGWYVAAAIMAGTLGGRWLDEQLGTTPLFLLLGVFLGLASAFYGTYRMLMAFLAGGEGTGNIQDRR